MNILPRKYIAIFFVIFQLFPLNKVQSQNIEEVIGFGDSLFQHQNYFEAINEYQRAFFFSGVCEKSELGTKIADTYLILNEIEMSQSFYDSAFYYAQNDSIKTKCILRKIAVYILEENFGYALLKLDELKKDSPKYFYFERELYQGISLFGMEDYDAAFQSFNRLTISSDSLKTSRLKELSSSRESLLRPNPTIAAVMSAIVPGTGQVYAGEISDGLNSTALLGGFVYLSINAPVNLLVFGPFMYRYYVGGIINASHYAKKRRTIKKLDYYNELMEILQTSEYFQQLFKVEESRHSHNEYLTRSTTESRLLLSFLFLFYKEYFSSQDVDACVFSPSCSVYTVEAIEKKGSLLGLLEGLDRLLRCHFLVNKNDYPFIEMSNKYYDPI